MAQNAAQPAGRQSSRKAGIAAVILTVMGVVAVVLAGRAPADESQSAASLLVAALIMFLGAALSAALCVVYRRHGDLAPRPNWTAARPQQRRILRAIRARQPLPGDEQALALTEATHIRQMWPVDLTGAVGGFAVTLALAGLILAGLLHRGLVIPLVFLLLLGVYTSIRMRRTQRRAADYLESFGGGIGSNSASSSGVGR